MKKAIMKLVEFSVNKPKVVILVTIIFTIESKDIAHEVGEKIKTVYQNIRQKEKGTEKYYMAGLPSPHIKRLL